MISQRILWSKFLSKYISQELILPPLRTDCRLRSNFKQSHVGSDPRSTREKLGEQKLLINLRQLLNRHRRQFQFPILRRPNRLGFPRLSSDTSLQLSSSASL